VQAFTGRVQLKGVARVLWAARGLFQRAEGTYPVYHGLDLNIDNTQLYQWWNVIGYGGLEIVLLLERLLRPGDVYVDVGANIGFMSLNAARVVGSRGKVLAIEPEPRARERLSRNIAMNGLGNIQVVAKALSDSPGTAVFSVATEEGLSRLDNGRGDNPCMVLLQRIEVMTTTLDCVIDESVNGQPVRFVKMDVEGSELSVLRGATNLLRRGEAIFVFESNAGALAQNGVSLVDINRLFEENEYETFVIESHSADWFRLGRFPTLRPVAAVAAAETRCLDCLAVPRSLGATLSDMIR
jgi:FkbM family methyltransferase